MIDLKSTITARSVPLRSIALRPIEDKMPKHHFDCSCEMCTQYEFRKYF